jgi:predicted nucleotidyltransferase
LIITRSKLIDIARREAETRAAGGDVISAYLVGSVANGEPLLGGTADIDLVLIHAEDPPAPREMVPLSAEIHLDIVHHPRHLYAQPRGLRVDPWLGPAISGPVFLYDPQHFFEWAQAGARGQFFRADHALARARALLEFARARLPHPAPEHPALELLLEAALDGANAAASLAGTPAAGRRLLLNIERQAQTLGRPEVADGLMRLFGIERGDSRSVPSWLGAWARAFDHACPLTTDPRLAACRRAYHLSGYQALIEAGRPEAVVIPLLRIWDRTLRVLETYGQAEDHRLAWDDARRHLGLDPGSLPTRLLELETYLDAVETLIDHWAARNGA